jgi:hypothetical protein
MKPLDDELKLSLRRVEPPPGFAERVLARARQESEAKAGYLQALRAILAPKAVRWAAALSFIFLFALFGAIRYRERQQAKIQAEIAGAQARLALQIASAKLNAVLRDAARPERRNAEN